MDKKKFLFEVSWEVCNKVGGIYTVITSKLDEVKKEFGDNYCVIGPWLEHNEGFTEEAGAEVSNISHKLDSLGIKARIGRWEIDGRPRVILISISNYPNKDKLLYQLWEQFGVDSMTGGWDYQEPVIFSTIAGMVIEALSEFYDEYNIIAQFHEWLAGGGLLYVKRHAPHISTVFTTHATILGRAMCGSGVDIYDEMASINSAKEAANYNVMSKYSMEKACAREADSFTTVSEITAMEAKNLLNTGVSMILPNGFNVKHTPEYSSNPEYFKTSREKLIGFAEKFLQKSFDREKTFIISTSGRYEFHNKGIDLLLDALGELKNHPDCIKPKKQVLVYLFVMAGSEDMHRPEGEQEYFTRYSYISTHPLWNVQDDPVIKTCKNFNLLNNPDDCINIIFVPVNLNGHDGVLNMPYYEALAGCDLTIYPSFYEPWGYTPLESIAYSIPTITTDLAGFGRWALSEQLRPKGIKVLQRFGKTNEDALKQLKEALVELVHAEPDIYLKYRKEVRAFAMKAEWEFFYKNYMHAFDHAIKKCKERIRGSHKRQTETIEEIGYHGADSIKPRLRNISVKTALPKELDKLRSLAYNLFWSWTPDAHTLFNRLDAQLYDAIGNNPVSLLDSLSPDKFQEMLDSETYMHLYEEVMNKFQKYMADKKSLVDTADVLTKEKPIAYFSMEFGFHESLPIYSGGLGILSGDHIKSASDINLNLVGVGLLYKKGYFKQGITADGEQMVEYYTNDFTRLPLSEVLKNDKPVIISIEYPGRTVYAKAWKVQVGRIPVYLLDTDILQNSPADRSITAMLYGGGKKIRIEQEIILGIGGFKLLQEMNITPGVYHMNEGHSAFLIVQRYINQMKYNKLDFETAREVIRSSTVFTTHTPVPAGNETFEWNLVENYLRRYVETNGLSWQNFAALSNRNESDTQPYEMTVLALYNSNKANGVSKLHGAVSRKMWAHLWDGFLMEEVPIDHITNGVHVGTWLSTEMKNLYLKYCSLDYNDDLLNLEIWKKIENIPDRELWFAHVNIKNKLFNSISERVSKSWTREGIDPLMLEQFLINLTSSPLTIGFSRRFATYKRATLLFRDIDRLKKLINNKKHPVQFVFSGKAHPDDKAGADLIKHIVQLSKQPDFIGKIIFIENYDIMVARRLVSSVDVWLNNPIRPYEASGTSGMKAGINGVVNFSILDGWWDEGWDKTNGWAIGSDKQFRNIDMQDISDNDSLFDILENEIIPAYYNRNSSGIPEKWMKIMKSSIISVMSQFNTHRMLKEYTENMYMPSAKKYRQLTENNFEKARNIAEFTRSIRMRFPTMHIENIRVSGLSSGSVSVNDSILFELDLNKGRINGNEIRAQMLWVPDTSEDSIRYKGKSKFFNEEIRYIPMTMTEENDTTIKFSCKYKAECAGKFNYGIRILPHSPAIEDLTHLNMVYWA